MFTRIISSIKPSGFGALYALVSVASAFGQPDPSGLWKWATPSRNGVPERIFNLRLKTDGTTLSGSVLTPNRTNDTFTELPLSNSKFSNSEISFEVARTGRGTNVRVTKYRGTFAGDSIDGTIESSGRNGTTLTNTWKAERNSTGHLVSGPKVVIKPGYDEYGRKIINETHFKELSVADAEKYLADHPDAVVLDTRTPDEFAEGHLPNAQNYNLTDEATYKKTLATLDKTKWYVVHSTVGHYRTVRALEYFEANGFQHAVAIDGGYNAWAAAGKPTVK